MASDTEKETLQCVACAARLNSGLGSTLDYNSLVKVMREDSSIPNISTIWDNIGTTPNVKNGLKRWAEETKNSANQATFDNWVDSSVWIAESLFNDNHFKTGDYKFYHADAFLPNFKKVFNHVKKEIKKAAQGDINFTKGTAGQIYNNLKLDANKWNPADMIAVKKGQSEKWAAYINSFQSNNPTLPPGISGGQMQDDLDSFLKSQTGKNKQRVKIISFLKDLYDYNRLIKYGMDSGEFVPVSLKLTKSPNPQVGVTEQATPADLTKYFKMKIKLERLKMFPNTQKSEIYFKLEGLTGKEGRYYFDARGFEGTDKLEDIQIEIKKIKADAAAGKLTLPVTTIITKLSGGNAALMRLKRKKAEIFRHPKWGLSRNLQTKLNSGIHGFMDYRLFDEIAKGKEQLNTEHIVRFGEYADWLSGGRTKQKQFMAEAVKNTNYNKAMDRGRRLGKVYDITLAHTQAKYMKNKIQSYELTYVVARSSLSQPIKDNILKSMWLYAASEGLHIFNKKEITTYMMVSSFIKCAK